MNERDLIATQTIKQVSEGGDQVRADLKATASVQDQLAASSANLAKVSETSANKQTSVAKQFAALDKSACPAARAVAELERAQRIAGLAFDQGSVSYAKANSVLDVYVQKANAAAKAVENLRSQEAALAAVPVRKQDAIDKSFGIGSTAAPSSARASASAFFSPADIKANETMTESINKLRASMRPLEEEQGKLAKEMVYYRGLLKDGSITADEFAAKQQMLGKRLGDFSQNLKTAGAAGRVMSGEMVNLGYQLNDIVTGLALGQSPFMILAQQGGQVTQIFQNSKASIGEFAKTAATSFMGMITPMRLFIGGAAGIGIAAASAAYSWTDAQEKIDQALIGIGRRTGTTGADINKFASDNATATGLSVSQARDVAVEFARTGQVAVGQLKGLGDAVYGFSVLTGKDATESAKTLAKALSGDLVAGAKELDQVYGAMDGRMLQFVATLQATGDRQQAQQIILRALEEQNKKAADSVGILTKAYNLLGNEVSATFAQLGKTLTFSLPGDRRSPLEVESEKNKGQFAKDSQAGDAAVKTLLPQIDAYEKLLALQNDLNKARESAGAQGLGGFNDAAATAAQNAGAATKEALETSIRYNEQVQAIRASWGDVSTSTALQLNALQNQLMVAQSLNNAERMRAQEQATINALLDQGVSFYEAQKIAAAQLAVTQAAAIASAKQQTEAIRDQNELAAARNPQQQKEIAAQQAYKQVLKETGDEQEALNRAAAVTESYIIRARDAQRQARDAAIEWQQAMLNGADAASKAAQASAAAAEAWENAARAASKGSFGTTTDGLGFGNTSGDTFTSDTSPSTFSYGTGGGKGTDQILLSGGSIQDAINAAQMVKGSGGGFFGAGATAGPDLSAIANLYDLLNSQTSDKSIQLSNDQKFMSWLMTQPQTLAVRQQMATLAKEMESLAKATDDLNGTMKEALSPYYSQDPRTSHIGFRSQGMADGGYVTVPGGASANDNMTAIVPVASGERIYVDPQNETRGRRGNGTNITVNMPVTVQGGANKDDVGRTLYQAGQSIARQLQASSQ
jgi:hypothetical protein